MVLQPLVAAVAGGDAFISICTWQAGYAMTDPGYSFYHPEVNMFDPGPEDRMGNMMKLVRALDHRCDETCQVNSFPLCHAFGESERYYVYLHIYIWLCIYLQVWLFCMMQQARCDINHTCTDQPQISAFAAPRQLHTLDVLCMLVS